MALLSLVSLSIVAPHALAGAGWADNTDKSGASFKQPTFYANSPSGLQLRRGPLDAAGATRDTGTALRKFVDPLALVDGYGDPNGALKTLNPLGTLGRHIPTAIKDTTTFPDADYYEIAVVEYREQLHSDLPKVVKSANTAANKGPVVTGGTTLRGYVQIWTNTLGTLGVPKGSQLFYMNGNPILDNKGQTVFAVGDGPHYLGPVIDTRSKTPVRLKFNNYLPIGNFDPLTKTRGGDSFVPTDLTVAGAGLGPNGAANPANPKPSDMYPQNRALIHLHGGDTPWISDGQPHSWITPAGETNQYKRGDTAQNVPDMDDPGAGSQTYYFPNQQAARMEWYHDHTVGATRLNVYAGEVSAFMIHDATEDGLKSSGALPAEEIPLIFEDKAFVPKDIDVQDAKWNQNAWGKYGDLWYPHVYESNQNPNSQDGTNPAGRWDYGPWFWPVFPAPLALPTGTYDETKGISNASGVQEAFADTPIINGVAYPHLNVEPKAYRFRLLNGSGQRYLNLGLYVAEPLSLGVRNGGSGYLAATPPVVTITGGGGAATAQAVVDSTGTVVGFQNVVVTTPFTSAPSVTIAPPVAGTTAVVAVSVNTEVPMVPAVAPLADPAYGADTYDGRPGGIPDPAAIGPNIIHIGTEGGFLAQPNVIPSTPVSYTQLRRIVTVLNVQDHGLYVGPAERADFVVDFSQFKGKTLIVYNDAPAPNPGFDARVDYYTGNADQADSGGAPTTLPGEGPNTRTIMRIQVSNTGAATAFDPANDGGPLKTALPAAFAASQDKPIVPQAWQNAAYPGSNFQDNLARIFAGTTQQQNFSFETGPVNAGLKSITLDSAGTGYTMAPSVEIIGGGGTGATATAVMDAQGGRVAFIKVTNPGSGYTGTPAINLVSATGDYGIGAAGTAVLDTTNTQSIRIESKGIQELFDSNYGRMNATFSAELPFTSVLTQTTIPVGYIDPPTESASDGVSQIWKVTHNGVDTHPVHFHLFNVQVINRVAWDGTVVALDPAEYGWKDTVKMNPLEDIYVALKPKTPAAPFGVPQSIRLFDPTQAAGATAGFSNVDPTTGLATTTTNDLHNYDWEYVWHCHILGHEENDFMRVISYNFGTQAPAFVQRTPGETGTTVTWADPTPASATTTPGNKQNEIGFIIQRIDSGSTWPALPAAIPQSAAQATLNAGGLAPAFGKTGYYGTVVKANTTSWTDITGKTNSQYRVIAFNSAGYSPATVAGAPVDISGNTRNTAVKPATLSSFSASDPVWNASTGAYSVVLKWATPTNPTSYTLVRSGGIDAAGAALPDQPITVTAGAFTATDDTAAQISTFTYRLTAVNTSTNGRNAASSATSQAVVSTPFAPAPDMPQAPAVANGTLFPNVNVSWNAPNSPYVTEYRVLRTDSTGAAVAFQSQQIMNQLSGAITPPDTSIVDTTAVAGNTYSYTVTAINGNNTGKESPATSKFIAVDMTNLNLRVVANKNVLSWAGAAVGANPTGVQITRKEAVTGATTTFTLSPTPLTWTDPNAVATNTYTYSVAWMVGTAVQPASTVTKYGPAGAVTNLTPSTATAKEVTLSWTDAGPTTSFVISRCTPTAGNPNCTNPGSTFVTQATVASGPYTQSGLTSNSKYVYRVTAINGTGTTSRASTGVVTVQ
jgi:FtsP/CotA-like multicopper oxidase with cupredoxin domain